jgi:sugar O-acyltransferase (sialic acid O-acetyltransferase NeuD family)
MNGSPLQIDFNKKKVCIVGAGGFAKEVLCCLIDIVNDPEKKPSELACFLVADKDFEAYKNKKILGVDVIPQSVFDAGKYEVIVGVGDPKLRRKIVNDFPSDTSYVTLIHPTVVMSEWVEIGEGSIITAGCILTCDIKIGKHAHLNLHTTIGHDCVIGDYLTTTPACNISGICTFGDCVYFGTNASVRQGISICDDVTVGMGGVVVKDIKEPGVYVGNPVKKLERS